VRNIFIHGINSLMGSHFAARCLQSTHDHVFYLPCKPDALSAVETTDVVLHAASQIAGEELSLANRQEIANRLHRVSRDFEVYALGRTGATCIDELWYFASAIVERNQAETLESLISACPRIGAKEFNYVAVDDPGSDRGSRRDPLVDVSKPSEGISDQEISRGCRAQNIAYRIFRASMVLGDVHPKLEKSCSILGRFFSALHSFKAEIEERSPDYFDFQALRCIAEEGAALNMIPAYMASDLLLGIARRGNTNSSFSIVSPQNTSLTAFYERVGFAYSLGFLTCENFSALNAIDRTFHERLGAVRGLLTGRDRELPGTAAYQAAGLSPDCGMFDEASQIEQFASLRRKLDEARAARRECVAGIPGMLMSHTIARGGSILRYFVGGTSGTAIVVLNALGQGVEYWYRLLDRLIGDFRVIIWEPRGTVSTGPPFGVVDQVDDLDAVLRHEGIQSCHLVGWCTGPKVAIDFYLRRPSAVLSMAFLNSTFKCDGSPEEMNTPYEQNLESLCRMLVRKPGMAASVMNTFQSSANTSEISELEGADSEQISVNVLSLMNADLKSYVLAPFKSEETTLNYAHQLIDFWAHDSLSRAADIQVPVLIMAAEFDQVVSPAASHIAAGLFPNARYAYVGGATHYCLYDRPDFVAGLLKSFFENPEGMHVPQRVESALSQAG
jgi:pimeloyl-ACP methyl ester carboxylesterase